MKGAKIRRSRLSLSAVIALFILGVFTLLFVDALAGALIIVLSAILYLILLRIAARFAVEE